MNKKFLMQNVGSIDFSVRTANVLKASGVNTLLQLVAMSDRDILKLPDSGRKMLNEIKECLGEYDLGLAAEDYTSTVSLKKETSEKNDFREKLLLIFLQHNLATGTYSNNIISAKNAKSLAVEVAASADAFLECLQNTVNTA